MHGRNLELYIPPKKRSLDEKKSSKLNAKYPEPLSANIPCCSEHGHVNSRIAWLSCTNISLNDRVKFMEDWVNTQLPILQTSELCNWKTSDPCPLEKCALLVKACCIKDLGELY